MVSIKWCIKKGVRISEPNENISDSYLSMAEESIEALLNVRSRLWTATISYYVIYYSLYAFIVRIGVKSEIHSCTIEFGKKFLAEYYSKYDFDFIDKAFEIRQNMQYYTDKLANPEDEKQIQIFCKAFYLKTQDVLSRINESEIEKIREKILNGNV